MRHRRAGSIASLAVLGGVVALAPAAPALAATRAATVTHLNCGSPRIHAGRALHCGVSVTTVRGRATPPTGGVSLATNLGASHGTLSKVTCVLAAANRRTGRCTFTYTPRQAQAVRLYATYAGDATHAASHASRSVTVIR